MFSKILMHNYCNPKLNGATALSCLFKVAVKKAVYFLFGIKSLLGIDREKVELGSVVVV